MAKKFTWQGTNKSGKLEQGDIVANNQEEAINLLRKRGIRVRKVSESRKKGFSFSFKGGVSVKELSVATRQFSTMLNSGLSLVQCLEILSKQGESEKLKEVMADVKESLTGGAKLFESFAKHKKIFGDLYVSMIMAGEESGALDVVLLRLADFLEKNYKLVKKVKGAMVYPGVVLSVAFAAIIVMLNFVIPTFAEMFSSMNVELPLITRVVLQMSHIAGSLIFWVLLVGGAIGFVFLYKRVNSTKKGKFVLDSFKLKIPIFGNLIRKTAIARFTRTLATMLKSGGSIISSLEITANVLGNEVIARAILNAKESIEGGRDISTPIMESGVFPDMVGQMIHVGEEAGSLDDMLVKVADFYDQEVDEAVAALTSAMEPLMIVFLGVIVGGMLMAMYMPMFKMFDTLG